MVILFRGTSRGKNGAPQLMSYLAGLSATKYMQKTLIIQFSALTHAENYLVGKRLEDNEIKAENYSFDDSGIDSLIRRKSVARYEASHFNNAVRPLVTADNLFDVVKNTKKSNEDFVNELVQSPEIAKKIISSAKNIYENIFVYVNGKDEAVLKILNSVVDKTVICVYQGKKEEILEPGPNPHIVITSFDYKSTYSKKIISKYYLNISSKVFSVPYNTIYRDYCTSGNLLQFILHNNKLSGGDYNKRLFDEAINLLDVIIEKKLYEIEEDVLFAFKPEEERDVREEPLLVSIGKEDVSIEETEKKSLFSKSKEININVITEVSSPDGFYNFDNDDEDDDGFFGNLSESIENQITEEADETSPAVFTTDAPSIDKVKEFPDEDEDSKEEGVKTSENENSPAPLEEKSKENSKKEKKGFFKKKIKDTKEKQQKPLPDENKVSKDNSPVSKEEVSDVSGVKKEDEWTCPICETVSSNKFCPECGFKRPAEIKKMKAWFCPECGTKNEGKFCMECGITRP